MCASKLEDNNLLLVMRKQQKSVGEWQFCIDKFIAAVAGDLVTVIRCYCIALRTYIVKQHRSVFGRRQIDMSQTGAKCAEAYDRWSDDYDTCENKTRDLDGKALRAQEFDLDGKSVIEFGCGTGRHTEYVMEKWGARLVSYAAADISEGMLKKTRARLASSPHRSKLKIIQHDLTLRWPFPDASVDLVFGDLVLEHLEKVEPFYAQAANIIKQGGTLFICEYHPYRQYKGGKAQYVSTDGSVISSPPSFVHSVSEYVEGALQNNFELLKLQEWQEEEDDTPRLLSLTFKKKE